MLTFNTTSKRQTRETQGGGLKIRQVGGGGQVRGVRFTVGTIASPCN